MTPTQHSIGLALMAVLLDNITKILYAQKSDRWFKAREREWIVKKHGKGILPRCNEPLKLIISNISPKTYSRLG